jgi:FKBP-type peptidyl-prolyl cis-trans isomerase FkpA
MKLTRRVIWLGMTLAIAACGNSGTDEDATARREAATEPPAIEVVEIVPGLSMRILREGTGATAEVGHTAVVHYTGWLYDQTAENNRGDKFDSSVDRGQHFPFQLGASRVIRGWDEGVVGMQIGEIRELTIAPELAYGERQVGSLIPPGSTLVFEVELADLQGLDSEPAATP